MTAIGSTRPMAVMLSAVVPAARMGITGRRPYNPE